MEQIPGDSHRSHHGSGAGDARSSPGRRCRQRAQLAPRDHHRSRRHDLVAEAGTGGDVACAEHPELGHMCFGPSGTVLAIKDGTTTRLVDNLPAGLTDNGEAIGPSDVAVADDGTVWFLVGRPGAGASGFRDSLENGAGDGIGHLYKVGPDGAEAVADLAQYETDANPDVDQPGNSEPDSNANSLAATSDGVLVADAGGNDLQSVAADGTISTIAVFPVQMQPAPVDPTASPDPSAEPAMIPMDPVPTSVVVGPDGAYYVGQLTGFPFPPGGASVFRVVPGEDCAISASGFTNIMDLGFAADGSLYVLEIAKDSLINAGPDGPPAGGLWSIPAWWRRPGDVERGGPGDAGRHGCRGRRLSLHHQLQRLPRGRRERDQRQPLADRRSHRKPSASASPARFFMCCGRARYAPGEVLGPGDRSGEVGSAEEGGHVSGGRTVSVPTIPAWRWPETEQ